MAEAHLDHPGEVSWFAGKEPKTPVGPCPHEDCPHDLAGVIAWGPDHEHYSLVECSSCGCRAWTAEYPEPFTPERPKYRRRGFVQVAA